MPCARAAETLYRPRMPSKPHEWLVELFRNRPLLAPELLRDALHAELPKFTEARIDSADLTDIQPTQYRADLVVLLLEKGPVLGIVVEAQLSRDNEKQFAWPVYVATLRARFKCPVWLLVVTTDEAIARWAAKPIELGGGNRFVPLVLHPSVVPEVTDEAQAQSDPELAVLSAVAHGKDADGEKAVRIAHAALCALRGLDPRRSTLYLDFVQTLSEAARRAMQAMDPAKYEYQSDFARRYVAEGRAALVIRQLTLRFGPLTQEVEARIAQASIEQLDEMGERLLTAQTLDEAIGSR
jgi:hypothetical protein